MQKGIKIKLFNYIFYTSCKYWYSKTLRQKYYEKLYRKQLNLDSIRDQLNIYANSTYMYISSETMSHQGGQKHM